MIKVTDLIKDGIWLAEGDVVVLREHNEGSVGAYTLLEEIKVRNTSWEGEEGANGLKNSPEAFEGWYVKSFTGRKNITGKQPVPDWCELECTSLFVSSHKHYATACAMVWALGDWHPEDTWKPDIKFLENHYGKTKVTVRGI